MIGFPVPGKQFMETVLRDVGDAAEHIGEPGLGVDVVELCRTDEAYQPLGTQAPFNSHTKWCAGYSKWTGRPPACE